MSTIRRNATGTDNTALGSFALFGAGGNHSFNTAIGSDAMYNVTTGSNNTCFGYQSGYNLASGASNIFIGYQAGYNETGSNKFYLDPSSTARPLFKGDFAGDSVTINGSLLIGNSGAFATFTNTAASSSTSGFAINLTCDNNGATHGSGHRIGAIDFEARKTSGLVKGASIEAFSGSAWGTTFNTYLSFSTTNTTSTTEKLRIAGDGMTTLNGSFNYYKDAEVTDAYVLVLPVITAYKDGLVVYWQAKTANTGACTLQINSLGAIPCKVYHDQDPPDNYIEANSMVQGIYDASANVFQILTPDANP
jgi:hypothetical protein